MRRIIVALLMFLYPCISYAQEVPAAQKITWQDCVNEAKRNHPDLVSARARIDQNVAQKNITRSNGLPQLSASGGGSRSAVTNKKPGNSFDYGVDARQLVFDGFKNSNDTAAARENIRAAQYNYDVVSSTVRLNLWAAFIDLLSAQENLKVVQDIAKRRQQSVDLVTLRYQDGREHKGSLLTAQANLAQAQFEVQQSVRNVEFSERRLSKEMGRSSFTPLEAQGTWDMPAADLTEPNFEHLVQTVPFLQELAAQKEAARYGVKSSYSNFFPQVYATAGAGRSDTTWPPSSKNWSAGLTISLPLFEGGLQQAELARSRAVLDQSKADERSGRDGMIITLAQTWKDWQDDVAFVSVQEQFLNASQVRSQIAEAQYSSGLITFNDWIIIEDDLVKNQKAFVQAKANALISNAAWLQAEGKTLDD